MSNWVPLRDALISAYLSWRYQPPTSSPLTPCDTEPGQLALPSTIEDLSEYTLEVLDIFSLKDTFTVFRKQSSISPAIDFAFQGYIVKTPVAPTIAVSTRTLELFHQIRQRKPSISIEAFTKVICDRYLVRVQHCLPHSSLKLTCRRYHTGAASGPFLRTHMKSSSWSFWVLKSKSLVLLAGMDPIGGY